MPEPDTDAEWAGRADEDAPRASRDEQPVGWGDERDEQGDDDLARLLADRPPHHDRL